MTRYGSPAASAHAVDFHHVVVDHRGGRLALAGEASDGRAAGAKCGARILIATIAIQGRASKAFSTTPIPPRADDAHDLVRSPAADHAVVVGRGPRRKHAVDRFIFAAFRPFELAGSLFVCFGTQKRANRLPIVRRCRGLEPQCFPASRARFQVGFERRTFSSLSESARHWSMRRRITG